MDNTSKPDKDINSDRRRLLGAGALVVGAAGLGPLGLIAPAQAQAQAREAAGAASAASQTAASFGPVKQIKAGVLDVGYVEAGPADEDVVPRIAVQRVIA